MPDETPRELAAYCGTTFAPGTLEHVQPFTGMPCIPCLAAARELDPPPLTGEH